jgi:transposase
MLEKMISLRDAAELAGISRWTLRRWLRIDLGITFEPRRGAKRLMRCSDLEILLRKHSGRQDWTLVRESMRRSA